MALATAGSNTGPGAAAPAADRPGSTIAPGGVPLRPSRAAPATSFDALPAGRAGRVGRRRNKGVDTVAKGL